MKLQSGALLIVCFIGVALLGCVFGCTRGLHVDSYTVDDGTKIDRMLGNQIHLVTFPYQFSSTFKTGSICYLDAERRQERNGNVIYNLLLTVRRFDEKWTAGSLTLIIDEQPVYLSRVGDVIRERDVFTRQVTDSLRYSISVDNLRKLADAYKVEFIVAGKGAILEGYFTEENFYNFRRFFEEYGSPADRSDKQTR